MIYHNYVAIMTYCKNEYTFTASSMDYGALMSTILLFGTCQTKQCALIRIEDDAIIEDVENFFVTLERTSGLNDRITLEPIDGEIQISDRDGNKWSVS